MRRFRRVLSIVAVVTVVVLAYPVWLAWRIWDQSHNDEVRAADAIVVLGAAQYNGRPSPVLKARLDHALYLYEEDLAPAVIVTGGKQEGDRFAEADVGAMYLEGEGVPPEAILAEDEGTTTLESLERVHDISREEGIDSVLLVSDPMHSERIKTMAGDLGFDEAWTSPASYVELNRTRRTKAQELLHEIASLAAYELFDR
ncbi:MAG TPA: YdcF family protein [Actinomycetota bacterium]|nr:YdcF family protein [Actinomycetota bacterium]